MVGRLYSETAWTMVYCGSTRDLFLRGLRNPACMMTSSWGPSWSQADFIFGSCCAIFGASAAAPENLMPGYFDFAGNVQVLFKKIIKY